VELFACRGRTKSDTVKILRRNKLNKRVSWDTLDEILRRENKVDIIKLVKQYYETSEVIIPQPVQDLISELERARNRSSVSPCEQIGYQREIDQLKREKAWLIDTWAFERFLKEGYRKEKGRTNAELKKLIIDRMNNHCKGE